MMSALLEVKNLKKYFNTPHGMLHAVDDVNFTIEQGKTLGVVGESGCGKSTLGRTILHLHESTGGQILFEGEDITHVNRKKLRDLREDMQIIFQDPFSSLNPRMTVYQAIADPLNNTRRYKKSDIDTKVHELMELVGLPERLSMSYPHELDGGRRQRIVVARAMALDPKFIVCDEPVSALDVSIQAQILNLMMDLQASRGLTYIFITHDLSVVRHISDEICVMYLGQVVEKCESKELFKNPVHPYTKALLSAIPIPDPNIERKPILLQGEITSPINPALGCRFASRCPYHCEKCAEPQILTEYRSNHFVSCCRAEEINK